MKRFLLVLLLLVSSALGDGLASHAPTQELLKQKPLCLTASGQAEVRFEKACSLLLLDNLLNVVQESYAAGLPEGDVPEFTVRQTAPGFYEYTNRQGQQTMVERVSVKCFPKKKITLAVYSEGQRFFGSYQSLCQVEVVPSGREQVGYTVMVYARPESAIVRFFARVTPVEMYFRHKMKEMIGLVVDVCGRIPMDELKGESCVASAN